MKVQHTPLCLLDANCPLRQMFDLIGNRWTSTVLFVISDGVKRYSELQRQIPDVTKMPGVNGFSESSASSAKYRMKSV